MTLRMHLASGIALAAIVAANPARAAGPDAPRHPDLRLGVALSSLRLETEGVRQVDAATTVDDWSGVATGLTVAASWRRIELGARVAHASGTLDGAIVELVGRPTFIPERSPFEQWSLDASAAWRFRPGRRARPVVQGGPGVRWRATDAEEFERHEGSRLTLHAAAGVDLLVGERIAIRPEARWRRIEGGTSEWEVGASFSWRLGRDQAKRQRSE